MNSLRPNSPDSEKETVPSAPGNDPDLDPKLEASESALPAELISAGSQHLHRKLGGKEVQLFAVGGAIRTCKIGRAHV